MWHILRRVARVGLVPTEVIPAPAAAAPAREDLDAELLRLLGRALAVRLVDAGSCNGCEFELSALGNAAYNLEGRGVHFVASPRHADMLLVTGPVSLHMRDALLRSYEAMPEPRLVVAVGDCVIVVAYGLMSDEDAHGHTPRVVVVDERNDIVEPGAAPRRDASV